MTPLASVRNAVIKAVPEIVELKFGCRVKITAPTGVYGRVKGSIGTISANPDSYYITFPDGHHIYCENEERFEILGRSIHLADVLAALEKKVERKVSTGDFEGTPENPTALKETYQIEFPFRKLLYLWNLLHDDLDWHAEHQPETVTWLAEILK